MSTPLRLLTQARFVLAVFLLSLGLAMASPALKPVSLEMVCAGGVMQLVERGDEGAAPQVRSVLDCPLCTPASAPPAALPTLLPQPDLPAYRPVFASAAVAARRSAAPPPARGPPARAREV
ncbi:MAG: hypothetical protein QE494_12705 [Ramlibacter sp.]|uniref:hypothetical protein n=1 Tax=Ramlibacter sp. TaxID=1917967 RepID=UPI00260BE758|nr:hypothetical protein [Ramlibacter sp.]MDH4377149.1 hypothetical protein [Ramlibacter sp.]